MNSSNYNFIVLDHMNLDLYNPNLKLFETKMSHKYPLGNDSFSIDHGEDYFAFFKRLGKVHYIIIQDTKTKNIVGTACLILRKYTIYDYSNKTSKLIPIWYMCDLKISKEHRGRSLTSQLFLKLVHRFIPQSYYGYLVSMDPHSQQMIHIMKNVNKFLPIKFRTCKLLIYVVSKNTMQSIEKYFIYAFGQISYITLSGKKDLILESSGKPMSIYHLQHSTFASTNNNYQLAEIPDDSQIMFCFPKSSPLEIIMNHLKITTEISATIISWAMNFFDWHQILTSDI